MLLIPLMGFSSAGNRHSEKEKEDIELRSGGIGVPMSALPPEAAGLYHEPKDGIISGAIGCQPDIHVFSKSNIGTLDGQQTAEHIVFTAGIKGISTPTDANQFDASGSKIYVQITSNHKKVLEQVFYQHPFVDPNTQKPFWVSTIYLKGDVPGGAGPGRSAIDLPTGDYSYKFVAKDKKGHVVDVWEPENHEFTITE